MSAPVLRCKPNGLNWKREKTIGKIELDPVEEGKVLHFRQPIWYKEGDIIVNVLTEDTYVVHEAYPGIDGTGWGSIVLLFNIKKERMEAVDPDYLNTTVNITRGSHCYVFRDLRKTTLSMVFSKN